MADIFISYARHDKALVAPLVAALESEGWSVWWDPEIVPGQEFDRQITRELQGAKAVIVVWTAASVDSRWVRGEARLAADRGVLVPVRFGGAQLPIDALALHTTDLDDWSEDPKSEAFRQLSRALGLLRAADAGTAEPRSATAPGGSTPPVPEALREQRGVSICVLPFANMSKDDEQEYFADGISEDIITDLSKVSALAVISRNSAFAFKGKHVDLRQVARQLEVTHVLEGSVRKSGNRVRITAQVIEAARDTHVWAERYDRDLSDIFALQDEISQAIVSALKLKLFPEEKRAIEDRGTTNVEAYDKYLRARALLHQQGSVELRRAIQIFRESLALDPGFVAAWYRLHETHEDAIFYSVESAEEALAGMAEAADRILALAPDAWRSHTLLAKRCIYQRRWLEAEAATCAALAAAPASEIDAVWTYERFLMGTGRVSEAVQYAERARQGDPLSLMISGAVQGALDFSGRASEADAEYERSKGLPGDRTLPDYFALFRALRRGDAPAARNLVRIVDRALPVAGIENLPEIFDQAETMLARLRQVQADPANQSRQFVIAGWAAWHGDAALAAAALRRYAIDFHAPRVAGIWHSALTAARRTPAFKQILRDLGLVDYWLASGKWGDFARPVGDDDFEIIK